MSVIYLHFTNFIYLNGAIMLHETMTSVVNTVVWAAWIYNYFLECLCGTQSIVLAIIMCDTLL